MNPKVVSENICIISQKYFNSLEELPVALQNRQRKSIKVSVKYYKPYSNIFMTYLSKSFKIILTYKSCGFKHVLKILLLMLLFYLLKTKAKVFPNRPNYKVITYY